MGSKKQNPPPPPPKPEEESSEEEEEVEEEEDLEEEEEEEEEVDEKEVEEESHQQKPQPSSSSGTESGSEEGDDDDDHSTSHPAQLSVKGQPTPPPPETVPNSDDDETESDGGGDDEEEEEADPASDSLPSATASAYTVKPITSVPVNSKVSKPTTTKRPLESSKGSTDRKKAKTGEENDKKGKGGVFPGRVWSEESEIVVLQGMLNYQKEKGPFRSADTGVFYEFVKGKLWDGVTKTQIGDKIKRLKTKYLKNVEKGKNGQDPTFPKPHDKKAYELSKLIWGGGSSVVSNGNEEKAKTKVVEAKTKVVDIGKGGKKASNAGSETKRVVEDGSKVKSDDPKGKKGSNDGTDDPKGKRGSKDGSALMDVDVDVNVKEGGAKQDLVKDALKKGDVEGDFLSKFPTLSQSFDVETVSLKDYLHLIGSQNASELEEEWKQLQLEEMNVAAKRVILKGKQTKLVLDAMKKQ